jgi:hypothetical protein
VVDCGCAGCAVLAPKRLGAAVLLVGWAVEAGAVLPRPLNRFDVGPDVAVAAGACDVEAGVADAPPPNNGAVGA